MNSRIHVVIPEDLAAQIDELVGKRRRSQFLADAALKEVKRRRLLGALERAASAWKDQDHPELKQGAAKWVERMRRQDEKRYTRPSKR